MARFCRDLNTHLDFMIANHVAMLLGCPPLIIGDRRAYIHAIQRAVARDAQPLRDFLARVLGRMLEFVLAVADGRADPSWQNEHGDPDRPPQEPRAHLGDTPPPDFSS